MTAAARPASPVPTGNTFDKHGSENPLVRRLMRGFEGAADALLARAGAASILDAGCGEGVHAADWAGRPATARVEGLDLADPGLRAEWAKRAAPGLTFREGDVRALPYADGEWDLVAALEVLEHVDDPERALAELARVARRHLLLSVPREPLWRGLNLARGAYLRELGNTPGHVNHWSPRAFRSLVAGHGELEAMRTPFPWSMVLLRLP